VKTLLIVDFDDLLKSGARAGDVDLLLRGVEWGE
jgi:hypothetical protein